MKKKLLAILTSVLLLMTAIPLSAVNVSAATSGDYTYTVTDGEATITAYTGVGGAITIPRTLGGYPVTTIGERAFHHCFRLTSVTIGDSVTTIGEAAFFNCFDLTSVTIGDSVTSIESQAFIGTGYYEKSDNWENGVLYIGKHLIGAEITLSGDYSIKEGTLTIADDAFGGCRSLTSVTIPNSVTTIGKHVFNACEGLVSVTIPDSVTSIGEAAFLGCFDLNSVTIGDSVTSIGYEAFCSCISLTSVTIPDTVTSIGEAAFFSCPGLTDVYYTGSEADRAAISISSSNDHLTNATWHYNSINPKDHYAADVQHSVMDTESGNGLAFQFELLVDGVTKDRTNKMDLTNATINHLGKACKVLEFGAVLTNNDGVVGDLTLDKVNDYDVKKVPAVYLQTVEEGSCTFATRIINIPEHAAERTVYSCPYYIVEVGGELVTVYGDVNSASCAEYM